MTRWCRRSEVLWRRSADRVLILTPTNDELLLLEGIGAAVWLLLERPATLDELAEILIASDGPISARSELEEFLATLVRAAAVEVVA